MPGRDSWEVCLYSGLSNYQVWCKNFRTLRRARRFMRKTLGKNETFYCATISSEDESDFLTYYWTGRTIIPWDKPWVLSRRQALSLGLEDKDAAPIGRPESNFEI
jgi:hypothetical protein